MQTTKQVLVPLWHYFCPECGIGDEEVGHLGHTHAIYCEVCLEDERHIRLKRWPNDDESGPLAGHGSGGS